MGRVPVGVRAHVHRAVRHAVVVDLIEVQGPADGIHVVGDVARAVSVCVLAKLRAALARGGRLIALHVLQAWTIDRRRRADAAVIDGQEVPPAPQRPQQGQPQPGRRDVRHPRPADRRHDRADRGLRRVGRGIELERDPDHRAGRFGAVQRHRDLAALGPRRCTAGTAREDHGRRRARGRREGRRRHERRRAERDDADARLREELHVPTSFQ